MADAEGGNGDARPRQKRARTGEAADQAGQRACCMISEMLEEAGFDRRKARALRRQVLEGVILLCRWQLDRMSEHDDAAPERPRRRGPQRVTVE